ncbi:unnamed protein product [Angiostrongylus costaricensis]|uniref:DUF268 domain-containing protein n=1 Tax=Angiostrongylus costaricensis TaxID=334426 RepID=A0A158PKJ9_ANGCS|nr:unnamed protein product [Angiostrongylus costaricensis]
MELCIVSVSSCHPHDDKNGMRLFGKPFAKTTKGYTSFEELEANVFRPNNFKIVEPSHLVPKLGFIRRIAVGNNQSKTPPKTLPFEYRSEFLMNGYKPVYHALQNYPITGESGFILGSETPWIEVYALAIKNYHAFTDVVILRHQNGFDFAISFSSIEHSGLGRYGDPIDPIGDLREVWKTSCLLKPGGIFFLGLPRGVDTLVFNLHRIYGAIRLSMIMTGTVKNFAKKNVAEMSIKTQGLFKEEKTILTASFASTCSHCFAGLFGKHSTLLVESP